MRKKTQLLKYLSSDFLSAAIAWCLFNIIRFYEVAQFGEFRTLTDFMTYHTVVWGQALIPFLWILLHYFSGYYNKPLEKSRLSELFVTFQTVFVGVLIIFFTILLNELPPSFHIYYEQFFILFSITFGFTYFFRLIITYRMAKKIQRREWTVKALILGCGEKAVSIKEVLDRPAGALGYTIEGYIDTSSICEESKTVSPLGGLDDLDSIIKKKNIEELIVTVDTEDGKLLLDLLYSLYQYKLPIKFPISYTKILTGGSVKMRTIAGAPLIDITGNNFPEGEKNIKHLLDKLISIIVLLFLSPFYAYLAIRVRMDSPGPVFFKQERIGYLGKPFAIYKFRTMKVDAEKDGPLLASCNDIRITKYGKYMRKYRFDELPQFWNVLKGDMSLVGPRPERKCYIDKIVREAPYFYLLHNVRPGITSWGMVKFGYASTVEEMIERMQYDILYYENMSLLLDVKILIYTVKTILTGKGV